MKINSFFFSFSTLLAASLSPVLSIAQKLPNVQQGNLLAPADIKIDGKTNEWNNPYQAYNHATSFYYTMANDNENLYLAIHCEDVDALTKITNRGIEFSINTSGKKTDKDIISITFPVFEGHNRPYINYKSTPKIIPGDNASLMKADSFMNAGNRRLNEKSKYIKVKGVPALDTMISVYNEDGVKARQAFDNKMAYNYELAIPLKYLNLSANQLAKFAYHIVSAGVSINDFAIVETGANGIPTRITVATGAVIPSKDHFAATFGTTDFWGEYTLAKK